MNQQEILNKISYVLDNNKYVKIYRKHSSTIDDVFTSLSYFNDLLTKENLKFFDYIRIGLEIQKLLYSGIHAYESFVENSESNNLDHEYSKLDNGVYYVFPLIKDQCVTYSNVKFSFLDFKNGTKTYCVELDKSIEMIYQADKFDHTIKYIKYHKSHDRNQIMQSIFSLFWRKFSSKIEISHPLVINNLLIKKNDFIESDKFKFSLKEINFYLKEKIARSYLIYGPPGSGKSELLKSLINSFEFKTVKVNINSETDFKSLKDVLEIILPEILVFEDIDHLDEFGTTEFLNFLETLNKNGDIKLILATSNQVTKLDPAIQRPGRFDQLIEVSKLDSTVLAKLTDNDLDLMEIAKDFPIAYVLEMMKRVKIHGKEIALQNIQDIVNRVQNLNNFNYSDKLDND